MSAVCFKRGTTIYVARREGGTGSKVRWALPSIDRSGIDRAPYISGSAVYGESGSTGGIAVPGNHIDRNGSDIAVYGADGGPCRYPAHRPTDYISAAGRLICGTCHPRAGDST